jgi:hypothetical protein
MSRASACERSSRVLPAGEHVASWDGTDARGARRCAGVYFVRLGDGVSTVTRKVLLTD